MKATIEQKKLLQVLKKITRFCGRENQEFHLERIGINSRNDEALELTVSNHRTVVQMKVEAVVTNAFEPFCVEAKLLTKMVSAAQPWSDGTIKLFFDRENMVLNIVDPNSTIELHAYDAELFEGFYSRLQRGWQQQQFVHQSSNLVRAAQRVIFSASRDEARPVLQCVHFNQAVAATDGFRIAKFAESIDGFEGLLHYKTLETLATVFGSEEVKIFKFEESNQVIFSGEKARVWAKLEDGEFPDYNKIVPQGVKFVVTIRRADLLQVIRAHQVLGRLGNNVIRLEFDGQTAKIITENEEFGSIETRIPTVNSQVLDEFHLPFLIAVNVNFLRDAVSHFTTDDVVLGFNANNTPILITPTGADDALSVVMMPMHLG